MQINHLDFYYYFLKSTTSEAFGVINAVLKIDGKQSVPISTRIKTLKKNWNSKEQCFEGKDSAKKEALKKIFEKRMESIRDSLAISPTTPIDPNDILRTHRESKKELIVESKTKKKSTFLEHFKNYIKNQEELCNKGLLEPVTVSGYIAKRNQIIIFLNEKFGVHLRTEQVDEAFMMELEHWLLMKGNESSTIAKYKRLIKTVVTWATKKKLAKSNDLMDYSVVAPVEKPPISLDKFEIAAIENARDTGVLNEDLAVTADIFIFCAETSLSYCDYTSLSNKLMKRGKNGRWWIRQKRAKTDVMQRIPLTDKAMNIIEKYGSLSKLPRKSNQKLNKGLKRICKICGIDKPITFHSSRKTAVDDMLNNRGMRESTIQEVVGWNSNRQLKTYARIKDETIEKEFFGE